jgi:methylase of polypeptide subunit release factors
MMKPLIISAFEALGYEPPRRKSRRYTISGLQYEAGPYSVGETPQGEATAEGAIRMIRALGLRSLRVLDICCGTGIIGLTIYRRLSADGTVKSVDLSDINIFNLNAVRRALKNNGLDRQLGTSLNVWLSDCFTHIPPGERFDLIVSNPPHFPRDDFTTGDFTPDVLGTFDANWAFHSDFYRQCHERLTPSGEVWFLENGEGATESDLLPFISANPRLKYIGQRGEPLLPKCFWMMSKLG